MPTLVRFSLPPRNLGYGRSKKPVGNQSEILCILSRISLTFNSLRICSSSVFGMFAMCVCDQVGQRVHSGGEEGDNNFGLVGESCRCERERTDVRFRLLLRTECCTRIAL